LQSFDQNPHHPHRIKIHFQDSRGELIKTIEGNEGDDILSLAHEHDIDLEGACEGSIACSTCHVILSPEYYDLLEEPGDDENDMLDMAFGLTDTSRLGCQVVLDKKLDGMVCTLPAATRNMFVDGEFAIPLNGPPAVYSLNDFVKVKSQHIIDTTNTLIVILSSGRVGNVCCKTRGLS
jgi:ferredoxin